MFGRSASLRTITIMEGMNKMAIANHYLAIKGEEIYKTDDRREMYINMGCASMFDLVRNVYKEEPILLFKKIIFNPPATIVFWEDGSKTVVKCRKGTEFDPYYGFTCALAKKIYGSNSRVNRIVNQAILESFGKGGNQK